MQFLVVEGAVVIDIELVEQGGRGGLGLSEIDSSILVGVESRERRGRERGRAPAASIAGVRETASTDASVSVFKLVKFIEMLLGRIMRHVNATLGRSPDRETAFAVI